MKIEKIEMEYIAGSEYSVVCVKLNDEIYKQSFEVNKGRVNESILFARSLHVIGDAIERTSVAELGEMPDRQGLIIEEKRYAILVLDSMTMKYFSDDDSFKTAREVLLQRNKRLRYFRKNKQGYWIQPEVWE